jgi:hypothetical protein
VDPISRPLPRWNMASTAHGAPRAVGSTMSAVPDGAAAESRGWTSRPTPGTSFCPAPRPHSVPQQIRSVRLAGTASCPYRHEICLAMMSGHSGAQHARMPRHACCGPGHVAGAHSTSPRKSASSAPRAASSRLNIFTHQFIREKIDLVVRYTLDDVVDIGARDADIAGRARRPTY